MCAGQTLAIKFSWDNSHDQKWVGFGGWFVADKKVEISFEGACLPPRRTVMTRTLPDWGKFGTMWRAAKGYIEVLIRIKAIEDTEMALWGLGAGQIEHEFLNNSKDALLVNMYQFSPEANFYSQEVTPNIYFEDGSNFIPGTKTFEIYLKSCNRCARFLPFNYPGERIHLSFTNHCTAASRIPCKHSGFGLLTKVGGGNKLKLIYGFQLECRYCKKFTVNGAHNGQRTAAQMKEDGARRRAFELLIMELYGESPQLSYRSRTGRELSDDIWEKFDRKCFNCSCELPTAKDMNLDHTRPLALLWPLDETATALCRDCNSSKSDQAPLDFYDKEKLEKLSRITGISLAELQDPSPNLQVLRALRERHEWFFGSFLKRPELNKVRDGKSPKDSLIRALQKVIDACQKDDRYDIVRLYQKYNSQE